MALRCSWVGAFCGLVATLRDMASGRHDDDVVQREEETHGPISRPALPRIADRGAASRVDAWFAIAAVFSSMPTVLAVFSATNLVYQIVRKPPEMLFPVSP